MDINPHKKSSIKITNKLEPCVREKHFVVCFVFKSLFHCCPAMNWGLVHGVTLASPSENCYRLQQAPVTLSKGRSRYGKRVDAPPICMIIIGLPALTTQNLASSFTCWRGRDRAESFTAVHIDIVVRGLS